MSLYSLISSYISPILIVVSALIGWMLTVIYERWKEGNSRREVTNLVRMVSHEFEKFYKSYNDSKEWVLLIQFAILALAIYVEYLLRLGIAFAVLITPVGILIFNVFRLYWSVHLRRKHSMFRVFDYTIAIDISDFKVQSITLLMLSVVFFRTEINVSDLLAVVLLIISGLYLLSSLYLAPLLASLFAISGYRGIFDNMSNAFSSYYKKENPNISIILGLKSNREFRGELTSIGSFLELKEALSSNVYALPWKEISYAAKNDYLSATDKHNSHLATDGME